MRNFIEKFYTEEQCEEYLFRLRWPDGFNCPKCGNNKFWKTKRLLYVCTTCETQTSVTAGTIFNDTRKPLSDWFMAIWWLTTQKYGASAKGLQRVLGLNSYQTAWTWLHKIRTAMVDASRKKLAGNVEVDESYLGGAIDGGKRGRGAENKVLILIAVELKGKQLGRARISIVEDATAKSLHAFIHENIEKGSHLITDAWNGYSGIENKGYERQIFNQTQSTDDDDLLPHVHLIISLLKRWLLGTHQGAVKKEHLQAYLDEYVFRFNRRKSAERGLLFYRLIENAMMVKPITYKELVAKTST